MAAHVVERRGGLLKSLVTEQQPFEVLAAWPGSHIINYHPVLLLCY